MRTKAGPEINLMTRRVGLWNLAICAHMEIF